MTIFSTADGYEVRDDAGRVVFGPTDELSAEQYVIDQAWSQR